MAHQAHPVPRGAHAGLYGSEGAQNSHGSRFSGRQVRARAQHHRLHHRPRPRQHPLRPPDHRRRPKVQPPPRGPHDPRQQAPEGEGARRQGQGQRQHDPPEVFPGRYAHPDRLQQRLGSGLHARPLHHRRRARPLGDQRRHRGRPVGAGRSTSGHILQREGGRGLDPDHQGQQQHRDEFYQGTQERWCHRCPECGEYSEIVFDNIHFDPEVKRIRGKSRGASRAASRGAARPAAA